MQPTIQHTLCVNFELRVSVQILLGLRNGTMLQLTASHTLSPSQSAISDPPSCFFQPQASSLAVSHQLCPQLQLVGTKHLGSLPVVLIPLPTAAGLEGTAVALGERMALLSNAPGTGRVRASPLAVAGVTHAVPLWQPATAAAGAGHSR